MFTTPGAACSLIVAQIASVAREHKCSRRSGPRSLSIFRSDLPYRLEPKRHYCSQSGSHLVKDTADRQTYTLWTLSQKHTSALFNYMAIALRILKNSAPLTMQSATLFASLTCPICKFIFPFTAPQMINSGCKNKCRKDNF